MKPSLIVCDEPVSALDVSIQSQILNLLADLRDEFSLTYLFISHDLSVIRHISDRVAVLYLGKIAELAAKDAFFGNPLHPYSQALISAIPITDPDLPRGRIVLRGDVPSPIDPPKGCVFSARCPKACGICKSEEPPLTDCGDGHAVACFFAGGKP
jgi:oligopeptide/dipeptide ABC transporter ATP-binding protein